ncbi:hypothetical protein KPL71_007201 [Citrus sinensis]|uniref:Uncharacterized protein n=1 Tax=Citrus sinensis TaxID=2711 RepID=A0ACB8LXF2_CITSI|nr:hypothetical protein KPL71_007201 [Citrus sinensis]
MITAELAILRELAFRRKVFLLRSQHDDGLEKKEKGLAPLQERPTPQSSLCMSPSQIPGPSPPSSSSPRLSGMKRPTPTSTADAECSSPELPESLDSHPEHAIQADSNFCSICHVPCSSAFNYNQHLKGRKHKAKLQELKLDGNSFGEDGKVANGKGWCMDGNSFKMHLGQKHLEERNKTELTAKSLVKVGEKQTWCRLCNIGFSSEELFRLHLNAKKHKALQRAKCTLKGGGEQKWCKLCDVWCPNGDAFKMHLDGKNHILRLYEIEKNRRAENLGSYSGKA